MRNSKLIPASAFIVMVMGTIASVKRTNALPGVNFWLGMAIAYMGISLVEEIEPDVGGGLSVLVMVSAIMGYGEDVAGFAAERTGGKIGQPLPTAPATRQARPPAIQPRSERMV